MDLPYIIWLLMQTLESENSYWMSWIQYINLTWSTASNWKEKGLFETQNEKHVYPRSCFSEYWNQISFVFTSFLYFVSGVLRLQLFQLLFHTFSRCFFSLFYSFFFCNSWYFVGSDPCKGCVCERLAEVIKRCNFANDLIGSMATC